MGCYILYGNLTRVICDLMHGFTIYSEHICDVLPQIRLNETENKLVWDGMLQMDLYYISQL